MDDASIQQESGLYQQGQFPSVVTTDDLVLELGRMTVDRLNKDKLLLSLLNKAKIAERDAQAINTRSIQSTREIETLRASNTAYEESNRKLGDELVIVRRTLAERDQKIVSLSTTLSAERQSHEQEKRTLLAECENLRAENSTLQSEKYSQIDNTKTRKGKRG